MGDFGSQGITLVVRYGTTMEILDVTSTVHWTLPKLKKLRRDARRQVLLAVNNVLGRRMDLDEKEVLTCWSSLAPCLCGVKKKQVYELLVYSTPDGEPLKLLKSALKRHKDHHEFASLTMKK